MSKANSFNIKHVPPLKLGPYLFSSRHTKFLVYRFFQHLILVSTCFLCLCCIASGAKLRFASVCKNILIFHATNFNFFIFLARYTYTTSLFPVFIGAKFGTRVSMSMILVLLILLSVYFKASYI